MLSSHLPYLPSSPWVYQFRKKSGKMLYIWKAKNLQKRVGQYFSPWSMRKQDMVHQADHIEYIETTSEEEALLLEEQLIKQYMPDYNRLLKHNSNYVFIKYTNETFPQVMIVRKRRDDGATYIWPKHRSKHLYNLMKHLRRMFKYRTMKKKLFNAWVVDMDFHLGLDAWWSVINKLKGEVREMTKDKRKKKLDTTAAQPPISGDSLTDISRHEKAEKLWIDTSVTYEEWVEKYQTILTTMKAFFEWKTSSVLDHIRWEIKKHSEIGNFERCVQLRDTYEYIQSRDETYQHVVLEQSWSWRLWRISPLNTRYVVILLHFEEGKIIDVIREKKKWIEPETLISWLKAEFGFTVVKKSTSHDENIFLHTRGYTRLKQRDKTALGELHEKFLSSYISSQTFDTESVMNDLLVWVKERYLLKEVPYHMECIDISHLSGWRVSGGQSCFINWLPYKKGYRQYKIASVEKWKSDDYASLKEIIVRRFWLKMKEKEWNVSYKNKEFVPNLFILDGGKGQLGIVREMKKKYIWMNELLQQVQFVALWKWAARSRKWKSKWEVEQLWFFDENWEIVSLPFLYDQIDRILVSIRDEAHRFANRYRKKRMSKEVK